MIEAGNNGMESRVGSTTNSLDELKNLELECKGAEGGEEEMHNQISHSEVES